MRMKKNCKPHRAMVGMQSSTVLWKIVWQFLIKLNIYPTWCSIGYLSNKNKCICLYENIYGPLVYNNHHYGLGCRRCFALCSNRKVIIYGIFSFWPQVWREKEKRHPCQVWISWLGISQCTIRLLVGF